MKKASAIVLISGDKILLLQNGLEESRSEVWGLPGGKPEDCDDGPEDTALRELYEETKIDISRSTPLTHLETLHTPSGYEMQIYYLDITSDLRPLVELEDGFEGYGWFTAKQAKMLLSLELSTDLEELVASLDS